MTQVNETESMPDISHKKNLKLMLSARKKSLQIIGLFRF